MDEIVMSPSTLLRTGAGDALQAAAAAALREIGGLGVYEGPPVQAAFPYALVEVSPESDWSHKSGEGREVRLAAMLHDKGESPARLKALMAAAEIALGGIEALPDWQLVTLRFVRSRFARDSKGIWTGAVEYRARMLRSG